ncbi:Apc13p-domain-containing protein [Rhypophila decipiens]|uniref:Apc13p-domain-containing protein n=1 Tax=Rhypophila decipiens TaxID=261697 RepID=A0AAN7B8V0_9PEZI|nr:Apc13p-domain-containing protein [Rhypophila decipiens]
MNKDANYTYIHMHSPRDVDFFEDFCKDKLPSDDIYVPPHLQPINPEDEDDVVPDQHAAFGIQKATMKSREAAWKDLGLAELMRKGPGNGSGSGAPASGAAGKAGGGRGGRAGRRRGAYKGMPR